MNPIYYIIIPASIIVFALGIHFFFQWWSYRREKKRDEAKRKAVDELLAVDIDDWYNKEYS